MKYYLYNENSELVQEFNGFDRDTIREAIIEQLKVHKLITLEKENSDVKYAGNTVLDVYEINPENGEPSLIAGVYVSLLNKEEKCMTELDLILCVINNTMISIELAFKELSYYHKLFTDLGFTIGEYEVDDTLAFQFYTKDSEKYCLWYHLDNPTYYVFQNYQDVF